MEDGNTPSKYDAKLLQADDIAVSSSGGKDSAEALAQTVERTDRLGIPRERIVVVHVDMGPLEHRAATAADEVPAGYSTLHASELAQAQAESFGVRFIQVSNPKENLMENWSRKRQNSRVGPRTCQGTSDFKRSQIWKVYTALKDDFRARTGLKRPCQIVEIVGLAGHESTARKARLEDHERDLEGWGWIENVACNKKSSQRVVWTAQPLIDVENAAEVFEACRKRNAATGYPSLHWVYSKGLPRLSCAFCVFMDRDAAIIAGRLNPALLEELAEDEKNWTRPWSSKFTLTDILEAVERGEDVGDVTWGDQA